MDLFKHSKNKDKELDDFLSRGALLLDVRTREELTVGLLPNAKNIPLQELSNHISELKEDGRPIVAYCEVGARSRKAVRILQQHQLEAINGGAWRELQKKLL